MENSIIKAVFFDVGETLINETRDWCVVADALGISYFTLFSVLGSVIERNLEHAQVFEILGIAQEAEHFRKERASLGLPYHFIESDLYADVRKGLAQLQESGVLIGIAGNQPSEALEALKSLVLPVDYITTSAEIGFSKPNIKFFNYLASIVGNAELQEIAYVGDRFDKDVYPAIEAGLRGIHIRRGPWGILQRATKPEINIPYIDSLTELTSLFSPVTGERAYIAASM